MRNGSILINLINEANLSRGSTLMAFSGYFREQCNTLAESIGFIQERVVQRRIYSDLTKIGKRAC